jgi:hypothetical protein
MLALELANRLQEIGDRGNVGEISCASVALLPGVAWALRDEME